MNPKIEVVKLNIAKKGQQVGTFSAKVTFEEKYEAIWPGMRIVEGAKGTFVDLPSRQFKEVGFVPFYYLNKALRDLITHEGLEAYRKAVAERRGETSESGVRGSHDTGEFCGARGGRAGGCDECGGTC